MDGATCDFDGTVDGPNNRSWLIYEITGSYLQLGLVSACRGIPLLLFGVVAGTVADRYGRKAQLIIAQTVNAILNLILATLVITGHIEVWHIYITAFLAGTVQAFQQPARQVLINDLVGGKHLMNAIALNAAAFNVSRSIGPTVAGLLITLVGTSGLYYAQAAIYAFATIWTVQIVVPKITKISTEKLTTGQSFFSSTKDGLAYIVKNRLILALMILGLAPILLGMLYTSMMPAFATTVFHGNANIQGWLVGAVGVGAVIGTLSIASMGHRQGNAKLLVAGATFFGVSLLLSSRSPIWQIAMIFTFCAGLSSSAYTTQDQTIIQTLAPKEMRGRVLGVYFLNRGLMPIGSLIAGALAQWLNSAPWAITIMGTSCVLVVVLMAILVPEILKLGNLKAGEGKDAPLIST